MPFHFLSPTLQLVSQDPKTTVDMKQPFNSTIVEVSSLFLRFGKMWSENLVVSSNFHFEKKNTTIIRIKSKKKQLLLQHGHSLYFVQVT